MITPIPNVSQAELTAVIQQLANSGLVHIQATGPTSGRITASKWPFEGTVADYALVGNTLQVRANRLEGEIRQQLVSDINQLRAQGI